MMARKSELRNFKKVQKLHLERLESRLAMDGSAVSAAATIPWFDPRALTYSLALDGTQLGDSRSSLFSVLNQVADSKQWHAAFDNAFSDWLTPLGARIREINDLGVPFGSFGPTQGDNRFGDVRIGAVPLSNDVMAEAIPHSMLVQGSWAGDILLNSSAKWDSLDQVYSAVLHEFGHVMGLGHSADPTSAMYVGGLHPGMVPSSSDIKSLKKIYAGVKLEHGDGPHDLGLDSDGEWHESLQFSFDPKTAIPLQAALASSAQYNSSGELTTAIPTALYQLLPLGEIDHATFLNVVVSSKDLNGLIPSLAIYDQSGDKIKFTITHNSAGVLALQAKDVEPNQSYYIAISSAAAPAANQIGRFEFLAQYGSVAIADTTVGTFLLGGSKPIAEYSLNVGTSRLIHWMINGKSLTKQTQPVAVWGTLVDSNDHVLSRIAIRNGDTRSAPLVLLPPGTYRILLQTGIQNSSLVPALTTMLFVDEISVDIGAGIIDQTSQPMIGCDMPGSNPSTCTGGPPIIINGPIFPVPATIPSIPVYPSLPPWTSPTWHYWPTISGVFHNPTLGLDVTGDSFVSPLDALAVINALNQGIIGNQPVTFAGMFLDTNSDGALSPLDVLLVINFLNNPGQPSGEGEASSMSASPTDNADIDSIFGHRKSKSHRGISRF